MNYCMCTNNTKLTFLYGTSELWCFHMLYSLNQTQKTFKVSQIVIAKLGLCKSQTFTIALYALYKVFIICIFSKHYLLANKFLENEHRPLVLGNNPFQKLFFHSLETIKYLCLEDQEGKPWEVKLNIQQKSNKSFFEVIRQILIEESTESGHSENVIYIEKK